MNWGLERSSLAEGSQTSSEWIEEGFVLRSDSREKRWSSSSNWGSSGRESLYAVLSRMLLPALVEEDEVEFA